ncbi:two-component response regulator, NarL subfamily [Crocosphaera subtropica ATCC 51142]|uniref:Two-component response regulator, NarL subfamily n=1 Tax=Crocosphaera subtropica (strain ATCC 51142 / BH68) TaxID=43989 RepID=B1WWD4_CROS5|nr:response regulator [Crocosphaera subtropica]ACB54062.1 two-component response regulator, NarL subfamily [Crocosphaera subtropica ATCC 51142]
MPNDTCHVLLIEDKLENIELLQDLLSRSEHSSLAKGLTFPITSATTLTESLKSLEAQKFDVILLDLDLPDSQGLDTLIKLRGKAANIPIIVEMDEQREGKVVESFQLGADGYLQIKTLDSNLLIHEIRLSIERQKYRAKINKQQEEMRQAQEFADLDDLIKASRETSVTARLFGAYPLKESLPDVFMELTEAYGKLLELSLEQRMFKVDYNISEQLRILGDKLGFLKASPRDAIEIHTKVLKEKSQDVTVAKAQAYVAEGRLMILELMGYLASFYRKYYIGLSNINLSIRKDYP